MRNLASIVTVKEVWALKGKDRVQGASFVENAYEAMIGKDIQVGELVAFIQEGSILPETEHWEFLRKRCFKEGVGHVIRVQKFKDIRSWGLVLKLNELGLDEKVYNKFKAGEDITDLLNIKKYEPAEDASPKAASKKAYPKWVKFCLSHALTRWIGKIWQKFHTSEVGNFPSELISKSDETTIQNYQEALEKFADEKVYTTIKMEGQSATAVLPLKNGKLGKFYVCSRNNAYKTPGNNDFWKYAKENDIEKKLINHYKKTGEALILQCEQCGPGIQKNIYKLVGLEWFVYTVKKQTKDGDCIQLPLDEMLNVVSELGLIPVPPIEEGTLKELMPTIDAAVEYAEKRFWKIEKKQNKDGTEYLYRDLFYTPKKGEKLWEDYAQHEGVVVRSVNYDKDKNVGVSFKVKNIDYAEKGIDKIAAINWK